MNKNLTDYIKIYRNHLPIEVCNSTVDYLNLCNFEVHQFYNTTGEPDMHLNASSSLYEPTPSNSILMEYTWKAINQYVTEIKALGFNSWTGFTPPKFNKYDPNTYMREHCDHIHSMFDGIRKGIPTLTVIGGLNNTYTGGNLTMFGGEDYALDTGDVIVFPSNFMYPHAAAPVITGVRYSYVSWVW